MQHLNGKECEVPEDIYTAQVMLVDFLNQADDEGFDAIINFKASEGEGKEKKVAKDEKSKELTK